MPLGQAPYGSRSPPTGDDNDAPPPQRPPGGMRGGAFGRFSWVAWVLLAVLAMTSLYTMRGGEKKPVSDSTECMTSRSCGEGWRCYAVPKDDPFAVSGLCSHTCDSDAACAAPLHCVEVAVTKDQVVPLNAAGAGPERLHVCRPP